MSSWMGCLAWPVFMEWTVHSESFSWLCLMLKPLCITMEPASSLLCGSIPQSQSCCIGSLSTGLVMMEVHLPLSWFVSPCVVKSWVVFGVGCPCGSLVASPASPFGLMSELKLFFLSVSSSRLAKQCILLVWTSPLLVWSILWVCTGIAIYMVSRWLVY